MKRKMKTQKPASKVNSSDKLFTTLEQVNLHFFPMGRIEKQTVNGKERGAEVAERVFNKIAG